MLVVHLGEVVSVDRLIDELWAVPAERRDLVAAGVRVEPTPGAGARPPHPHTATLLVTEAPGYAPRVDGQQVDAGRFESLATAGRQTLDGGDAARAACHLR